jgi:hypothetical protein
MSALPRIICALASALIGATHGASLKCLAGVVECIETQGTRIPSSEVVDLLDLCDVFTRNDIGATVLRLSYEEFNRRVGDRITPLSRAWFAYDRLYSSPLKFQRKAKAEENNYLEIKRSCRQLNADFYDDAKWKR